MTELRPMADAPDDGSAIVVDEEFMGFVVVRWINGVWDSGFASEMDGDPIISEDPKGWIKLE